MRVALISDIHGYLVSFEAVLADIAGQGVDQIIFLGDALTMGPRPLEVLARLRALNCPCIMGNHDTSLLQAEHLREEEHGQWYIELAEWCAALLSADDFAFVRSFQTTYTLPLGPGVDLLCFHGSPRSNEDMILITTPAEELAEMFAQQTAFVEQTAFAEQTAAVLAGGHSHVQMIRRYGKSMLVNAGSVGLPLEYFPFTLPPPVLPWAEYGLVSYQAGALGIALRQVPFDLAEARKSVLDSDIPGKETRNYW